MARAASVYDARMRIRHAAALALLPPVVMLALASCEDSSSPAASAAGPDATVFTPDGSTMPFPDATTQDVVVADAGADSANPDAGPFYDEAGCPLPTGVVGNLADAGFTTTGLALWLRADLGLAATDGGVVCRWDDVSGHDRAFLPATAAPPSRAAAALNGKPAVVFSGPNQHLIRNDVLGLSGTSGRTVAVFAASNDTTSRYQLFVQAKVGTAGTYFGLDANTFSTVGSREGAYVTNNAYDSDLATSTTAHTQILSISSFAPGGSLPGVLVYAVDGTVRTLTRTSGGLGNGLVEDFSAADTTFFGAGAPGYTGGKLGEMLVWDRKLTAPERLAVEQYFQRRY